MFTFVWMDLCGSSGWLERLGDERYAEQMEAFWAVLGEKLLASELNIYQHVGDAVILYAEFDANMENILAWVREVQELALREFDFVFRAALHRGKAIKISRDGHLFFYGRTLNELYALSQQQKSRPEERLVYSAAIAKHCSNP